MLGWITLGVFPLRVCRVPTRETLVLVWLLSGADWREREREREYTQPGFLHAVEIFHILMKLNLIQQNMI